MKIEKLIGSFIIIGAVGVFIPYTILTAIFEYPVILRQDTATILTKFHEGGNRLIFTWFAFALAGIPLLPAYIMIGKKLESRSVAPNVATTIGVIGLIVQMIGLLRWTFVVPVLSNTFVQATDEATKAAAIVSFKAIHQFAGVILGEHLGQLFTITWTILMSFIFAKNKLMPWWVNWLGYVSAVIYFLAQAELLATVIAGFPVWGLAGFIGSTLWLIWLIIIGFKFLSMDLNKK
jgi:hypothetical protein